MINIFWFRNDLRLTDNHGLFKALNSGLEVLPIYIFDKGALNQLSTNADARIQFVHTQLQKLNTSLAAFNSSVLVLHGQLNAIFDELSSKYAIHTVFVNSGYEPKSIENDRLIALLLSQKGIQFSTLKDRVIFEKSEITKDNGLPYTVFTPYANKWKSKFKLEMALEFPSQNFLHILQKEQHQLPSLSEIGFSQTNISVPDFNLDYNKLQSYAALRNIPSAEGTTHSGTHLRYGTLSIRKAVEEAIKYSETFLNELIWREFFIQILYHFPHSATNNFNSKYDRITWRNNENEFRCWCEGKTGYPMVDAGMRELNETGLMHNRVRMITSGFLTKHLLIDWRWGEIYFASKLLDYELSSNVGNWQWAAGTGCDAAPYFRVFNPTEQIKKFDPRLIYIQKWVDVSNLSYEKPIVEHVFARNRAIATYKKALVFD